MYIPIYIPVYRYIPISRFPKNILSNNSLIINSSLIYIFEQYSYSVNISR